MEMMFALLCIWSCACVCVCVCVCVSVCLSGWLAGWLAVAFFSLHWRLSSSKACDAVTTIFKIFMSEDEYRADIRQAVGLRLCLPLLKATTKEVVLDFFVTHIVDIMKVLEARVSKVLRWPGVHWFYKKENYTIKTIVSTKTSCVITQSVALAKAIIRWLL